MTRYGKLAQQKVRKAVREFKRGVLRPGSGKKVSSRLQAISDAHRRGEKSPSKHHKSKRKRLTNDDALDSNL